jgi:hypothetical protein
MRVRDEFVADNSVKRPWRGPTIQCALYALLTRLGANSASGATAYRRDLNETR